MDRILNCLCGGLKKANPAMLEIRNTGRNLDANEVKVLEFWEWAFEAHYKHKEKKFTNIRILPLIPLPSNVLLLETERKEINKT